MPPGAPGYQQPFAPVSSGKRGSAWGGILGIIMGGVLIASTFLPWLSARAFGVSSSSSGFDLMRGSSTLGGSGFTLVLHGSGTVFLTGFFSLLFGVLILAGAVVMLFRRRVAGVLIFILALLSTGAAAVNLAMVYSKMNPVTPGFGLWMFAGASLVALGLGIVGLASAGG